MLQSPRKRCPVCQLDKWKTCNLFFFQQKPLSFFVISSLYLLKPYLTPVCFKYLPFPIRSWGSGFHLKALLRFPLSLNQEKREKSYLTSSSTGLPPVAKSLGFSSKTPFLHAFLSLVQLYQ